MSVDIHKAMGSVDHVAQNYKSFFADCVQVTPRLSKQQLTQAICLVHPGSCKTEVSQFAGSLVNAYGQIRQKTHVITSGARSDPALLELTSLLQQRKPTLGSKLKAIAKAKAQALLEPSSNSSTVSPIEKRGIQRSGHLKMKMKMIGVCLLSLSSTLRFRRLCLHKK